MIQVYFT